MGTLSRSGTYEVEVAVPGLPGHRCWFVVSEVNRRRLRDAQSGEGLAILPDVILSCLVRIDGPDAPDRLPETPEELMEYLDWGQLINLALRLSGAIMPLWKDPSEQALFHAIVNGEERLIEEHGDPAFASMAAAMIQDAQLCCYFKWPPSEVLNMPCQLRDTIWELIRIKKANLGGL